ncbi:MAG: alpha/beta hydrolase, partial [Syntrophales bacterium]|nr:alpha/beta hydrolase [Syntrophales bacterium]
IKVPTLIVCGREDKMTPPSLSEQLHAAIPGSRLAIIEGGGHFVMMEQAEEFNTALRAFVQSL